jgi:ribosome biogenesis GTPase
VGKSTIINRLFVSELQSTGSVSTSNGKGRHTTTRAELLVHSSGCSLIDTPGLRELQLWCDETAVDSTFSDIRELIQNCRFHDCSHSSEPDCAIQLALHTTGTPSILGPAINIAAPIGVAVLFTGLTARRLSPGMW